MNIFQKMLLLILFIHTTIYAELMEYNNIRHQHHTSTTKMYGTLNIKGSHTIEKLFTQWSKNFQIYYPNIRTEMNFENSTQGIEALRTAKANIAVTNRQITKKEKDIFKEQRGYLPTEIKVSLNVLAVYVNRENKIDTISLPELDAIFSTTLKRSYKNKIENWKDISNLHHQINLYLYDINSTQRSYFKEKVMLNGLFNYDNIYSDDYHKSSQLIDDLASDIYGIGFASMENTNYKVKALGISKKAYFPSYKPNNKNIRNGKYPLTKFFYMYLNIPEDKPIPKLLYEFCKYILSKNGQQVVTEIGGLALSSRQVGIELSKIRR